MPNLMTCMDELSTEIMRLVKLQTQTSDPQALEPYRTALEDALETLVNTTEDAGAKCHGCMACRSK